MKLSDKAQASLDRVIERFKSGDLSPITNIARFEIPENVPCFKWSFSNKVLAYIQSGDPFALCFEHLLPWIHTLMLAYPIQTESKEVKYALPSRSFSRKSVIRVN